MKNLDRYILKNRMIITSSARRLHRACNPVRMENEGLVRYTDLRQQRQSSPVLQRNSSVIEVAAPETPH
jgi:hypothetical protein